MSGPQYGIILVPSTSHALKGERVLKEATIACKLIPVPRQISSDCGSCLRVDLPDLERAVELLHTAQVGIEGTASV